MLYTHDHTAHTHHSPAANTVSRKATPDTAAFPDHRPEALTQLKLQQLAHTFSAQQPTIQRKENKTGLPDNLKSGIENLSGYSLDDVKVHYNSAEPANLQAHAFAQGTDIHLAPGQEQHLPHEAWHVVQQKQGRVKPTRQLKGKTAINDDAGLEREADTMGAKALQLKKTDQQVVQRAGSHSGNVVQLVQKEIGKGTLVNQQGIVDEYTHHNEENTVNWPHKGQNPVFSEDYGGSVRRALNWGETAREGITGWTLRYYNPQEFHDLASDASDATQALTDRVLDNEKNKTLIAVRTFRSGTGTGMAQQTLNDLHTILELVRGARMEWAGMGHVGKRDKVAEIEADPSEAHPNTLPTAKITFKSGETAYFKGRSADVESALIGGKGSTADNFSKPRRGPLNSIATHSFLNKDTWHLAEDVGSPEPREKVSWHQALAAWVSGARTAFMVMITGSGDLHSANILEDKNTKKHIIDGEFLLEMTNWDLFQDSLNIPQLPLFEELASMVPDWAKTYVHGLDAEKKNAFATSLRDYFDSLGYNNRAFLDQALQPIRELIQRKTLLRVSPAPIITATWLEAITNFHNSTDKDAIVESSWDHLQSTCANYKIKLSNEKRAKKELEANFSKGQVPLLHIDASTLKLYLNKQLVIGEVLKMLSMTNFIDLTTQVVLNRYNDMLLEIEKVVKAQ